MGAIKVTFDVDGQHYDVMAASAVALQLECAVGFPDEAIKRLSEGSFEFALRDPKTGNKIELIGELARCERAGDSGRVVRIWIGKNERNRSRRVRKDAGSGTGEKNEPGPFQKDAGSGTEDADSAAGEKNESRPVQPDAGPGTGEKNESAPSEQDAGSGIPDAGFRTEAAGPVSEDAGSGIPDAGSRIEEAGPIAGDGGSETGERKEPGPDQQNAGSAIPDAGSRIEAAGPTGEDAGPGTGEKNESVPGEQDAGSGIPEAGLRIEEAGPIAGDGGSGAGERKEPGPGEQDAGSGIPEAGLRIEDTGPIGENSGPGTGEKNESVPSEKDAGSGIPDAGSRIEAAGPTGEDAGPGAGERNEAGSNQPDAGLGIPDAGSRKEDAGPIAEDSGSGTGERNEDANSFDVGRMIADEIIAAAGGKGNGGKMDAGSGMGEDEDATFLDVGRMLAVEMLAVGGDKGGAGKMDAGPGMKNAGSRMGERDEDTNSLDVGRMKAAKTIAVGGGKGGVGKTIFAVNLALALSRLRKKVTLLDGDINNCNCNTLLGITKVASSLEEYLRKERSLDEITVSTAYPGLRLVCGAQNKVDAFLTSEMSRLLEDIRQVDADCLVIDLGAGVNDETLDLYRLADEKILLVTPQVTSLQNAYGFIKSAFFHDLKRSGGLAALLDKAGSDPQKLRALIAGLEDGHAARHAFDVVLARQRFQIVGNMMNDDKDLKIIQNLQKVVGQYLRIENTVLGTLASHEDIRKSVNRITPYLVLSPDLPQSREMKRMAERLIQGTTGMPT